LGALQKKISQKQGPVNGPFLILTVICFFPDCVEADSCAVAGENAFVVDADSYVAAEAYVVAAVPLVPAGPAHVAAVALRVPVVLACVAVAEWVSVQLPEHNAWDWMADLLSAVGYARDCLLRLRDCPVQDIAGDAPTDSWMVAQVVLFLIHAEYVPVDS
jgi:hypothetical protein